MLEPYAVKVACTVLRRERAGNRSFLFDYEGKLSRTVLRRVGASNRSFLFGGRLKDLSFTLACLEAQERKYDKQDISKRRLLGRYAHRVKIPPYGSAPM